MGAIWQQSKKTDKRGANDFKGGINQGKPPFDIEGDESTEEYGWDTDHHPALTSFKKPTALGDATTGVSYLLTNFGSTYLIKIVGTTMYRWDSGAWVFETDSLNATDWDSTNFNSKLIMTNGTDNVKQYNGTSVTDLNATDAPKGNYITSDTLRVWIALNDEIHYSAFQDETDWTTAENSGIVQYYTPDGGNITGLVTFLDDVHIFKKRSMAVIQGDNYYDYTLVEVSNDIGCVSFKTIQEVGDLLFWLGENNVYAFAGGRPFPIGEPIRKYVDDINQAQVSKCFSGTDGLKYYLGLVTGASTEPDVLLIYDPRYRIWRVASLNDNFRRATFFNNQMYTGDINGQVWTMRQTYTGSTFSIVSKPFNEDIPETEKEWYELHLQVYMPTSSTMTVYVSTRAEDLDDGDDWIQIDTLTTDSLPQNQNLIIPLDTVPLSHWLRYKLEGTGEVKIYGVQRYFRVQPTQH